MALFDVSLVFAASAVRFADVLTFGLFEVLGFPVSSFVGQRPPDPNDYADMIDDDWVDFLMSFVLWAFIWGVYALFVPRDLTGHNPNRRAHAVLAIAISGFILYVAKQRGYFG